MQTLGMIEASAQLTQLCEEVYLTKEPIVLTRKGRPFVRSEPIRFASQPSSAIWERRSAFIKQHGESPVEFDLPKRIATCNVRDFQPISGIQVEDWSTPVETIDDLQTGL